MRAPQIDARHPAGRQPAGDGGEDRAPPAAQVEDAFVAAQAELVEDTVPHPELAAPGGVVKAERVAQEERAVGAEHRRQTAAVGGPRRRDGGDHESAACHGKRDQGIGGVVAVVSASLHRDDIVVRMTDNGNWDVQSVKGISNGEAHIGSQRAGGLGARLGT